MFRPRSGDVIVYIEYFGRSVCNFLKSLNIVKDPIKSAEEVLQEIDDIIDDEDDVDEHPGTK